MNSFYGGGGVDWTRTTKRIVCRAEKARGPAQPASDGSRYRSLPASTLHGSQSGADPGPSNPAGCHTSYAREQSPPERITSYAERRG